jgi:flagellar assembly factor FliW
MTQPASSPVAHQPAEPAAPPAGSIPTRFGPLEVQADKVIEFAGGLYGFTHLRCFVLTDVPGTDGVFKLLQAVDDPELGLIVLPLDQAGGLIAPDDLERAIALMGADPGATVTLGIVAMRPAATGLAPTINLKAPLLIDTERRVGRQHVFVDERYPLRHPLALEDGDEG